MEGSEQKGVNYWNCYITLQHPQCESAERAADTSRSKQTVRREVDKRRKILLVAHKVCGGAGVGKPVAVRDEERARCSTPMEWKTTEEQKTTTPAIVLAEEEEEEEDARGLF